MPNEGQEDLAKRALFNRFTSGMADLLEDMKVKTMRALRWEVDRSKTLLAIVKASEYSTDVHENVLSTLQEDLKKTLEEDNPYLKVVDESRTNPA